MTDTELLQQEAPELAAPTGYLQLSAAMLSYLRPLAGLPVPAAARLTPEQKAETHRRAVEQLLLPPGAEPELSPAHRDLVRSVAAPGLVVRAHAETLGAVLHLELRQDELPVLVDPLPDSGDLWITAEPELRDPAALAGWLADLLDLTDRSDETAPPPGAWTGGAVTAEALAELRALGTDAAQPAVDAAAARAGTSSDFARAVAEPVAIADLELLRFTGPDRLESVELVWFDGGSRGVWLLEPDRLTPEGEVATLTAARRTPDALAAELAGLISTEGGR